jgi:hypothetical protein
MDNKGLEDYPTSWQTTRLQKLCQAAGVLCKLEPIA